MLELSVHDVPLKQNSSGMLKST